MLFDRRLLAVGLLAGHAVAVPTASSTAETSAANNKLLEARRLWTRWGDSLSHEASSASSIKRQDDNEDPAQTAYCVEVSLSYPRWDIWDPMYFVHNVSTGSRLGDFRFAASNIAFTDLQADCIVRNLSLVPEDWGVGGQGDISGGTWHDCSLPGTQFQFNLDTWEIRMRGNWSCGSNPLRFVAEGSQEVPLLLGCLDEPADDTCLCLMSNTNIWPRLTSPVAITPVLPQLPFVPWERAPLCSDRSIDPSWQIDGLLVQHFSSAAESRYELAFDIANQSNDQTVRCVVLVDELATPDSDHSARWLECGSSPTPSASKGNEVLFTEVMFDDTYNLLGVRQTWTCSDAPSPSERFSGVGYLVTSSLQCTAPSLDGTVSKYNCTLPSPTTIDGYNSPPPALPHTAYERSCTLNSFNATAMELRSYSIQPTEASFEVYNPGSGDTYDLRRMAVSDDEGWHNCVPGDGEGPLPWQLMGCRYSLSRGKGEVVFELQWFCDDRDPTSPILFSATAQGKLPASRAATSLEISPSSLSWRSTTEPMQRGPLLPWI